MPESAVQHRGSTNIAPLCRLHLCTTHISYCMVMIPRDCASLPPLCQAEGEQTLTERTRHSTPSLLQHRHCYLSSASSISAAGGCLALPRSVSPQLLQQRDRGHTCTRQQEAVVHQEHAPLFHSNPPITSTHSNLTTCTLAPVDQLCFHTYLPSSGSPSSALEDFGATA